MNKNSREIYIDVLKALAIIAVVIYHWGKMPLGYLGVDIFLVINGFLITKSLKKRWNNEMTCKDYCLFQLSRIERLLPPLLVAGIICMIIGYFIMIDDTYESLSQSVIATNFFANNIVELIATGDYWANDKIFSPLMHTWYVGLIMQFYLIYPLLFIIAYKDKSQPNTTLIVLIATFAIISLLIYLGENNIARRFYLLPTRFFEFALGGIVALTSSSICRYFSKTFVYICYCGLLLLLITPTNILSSNLILLLIALLTAILLYSKEVLNNNSIINRCLAKIGAASYSIFIWHQIVLAFYRSIWGNSFSIISCIGCLIIIVILSIFSYYLIEKRTHNLLKTSKGKYRVYLTYGFLFIILSLFSFKVYFNAGAVRDIPELEVNFSSPTRAQWASYNNRVFEYDKDFETDKCHWFVIGNSFGRDFVNIIEESSVADLVEVSYCGAGEYSLAKYEKRFLEADKIFISSKGFTEQMVHEIEIISMALGHTLDDVIIVGDKYFGDTMTQVYSKRFNDNYYQTCVNVDQEILDRNEYFNNLYGMRYIDLFAIVENNKGQIRVFTDNNMFISSDCIHLTQEGASYFAERILFDRFIE